MVRNGSKFSVETETQPDENEARATWLKDSQIVF